MHDMMKKIKSGDKESIAIMLLEAPDRSMDMMGQDPEQYAMEMAEKEYGDKKMDGLKKSILAAMDQFPMPEDMKMAICKAIYDGVKKGDISAEKADEAEEENSNPDSYEVEY